MDEIWLYHPFEICAYHDSTKTNLIKTLQLWHLLDRVDKNKTKTLSSSFSNMTATKARLSKL